MLFYVANAGNYSNQSHLLFTTPYLPSMLLLCLYGELFAPILPAIYHLLPALYKPVCTLLKKEQTAQVSDTSKAK